MPLPNTVKNKQHGDLIKSLDWNTVVNEVERLDTDKVNKSGDTITGTLNLNGPLRIQGGDWNVSNSEGDLRIGNSTHRLKIGVATAGGGAGDVRIRAAGGSNRLMLGAGTNDSLKIFGSGRLSIGADFNEPPAALHIRTVIDVGLTGAGGSLLIGNPAATHMSIDDNEIMVKSNGTTASTLYLQNDGGTLSIGGHVIIQEPNNLSFQSETRQMINLYSTSYGIGVQGSTTYFRSGGGNFAFYQGGLHNNNALSAGGGTTMLRVESDGDFRLRSGATPIFFRRYTFTDDASRDIATNVSTTNYTAAVVGVSITNGDLNENGAGSEVWRAFAWQSGGTWRIRCAIRTHGTPPDWDVYVMFVSRYLSTRNY